MSSTTSGLKLGKRMFSVEYREISDGLWRTTAEVKDDLHEIRTTLDFSVPNLRVVNADIQFVRCPFKECEMARQKARELIGTPVQKLGFKNYRVFLGKKGCPNAYLLFGLSGPAFNDVYYLNEVNKGTLTKKAYDSMMKNECVAHRAIASSD